MERAEKSSPSVAWLFGVYIALMVLLGLTILAAAQLSGPLAMVVAMLIAATKAILVILYFMHVRYAFSLARLFVGAGFLWLAILFALTFAEYAGR